jgi:ribonuclease BN (tRNA processing enzyme)
MLNWLQYRSKYHTTTTQLAEIANKTQPGLLIVYHRVIGPPDHEITDEQYLAEIRRTYRQIISKPGSGRHYSSGLYEDLISGEITEF